MGWIYDDLSDDEPLRYKILKYHKNWLSLYHNFNKQSSKDFENRISRHATILSFVKSRTSEHYFKHESVVIISSFRLISLIKQE